METHVLVVEDDAEIREGVSIYLKNQGYAVHGAANGAEGLEAARRQAMHLAIVDVMMPVMDGITMVMKLRAEGFEFPVIMLSAKSEDLDKITGLNIGADDYVTKPFSPSELTARVDAVYRRVALAAERYETQDQVAAGEFILNLRDRSFTKGGAPIELTQVEFQIMEYFLENPGIALARGDILRHVWGPSYVGEEKIVDVNIRRLRMKVEDEPSNPQHITTVWGLGYRWKT